MSKPDYPITAAIRFLREQHIDFTPHLYDYQEKGGTRHSAACLNIDEHHIIKTIVLQNEQRQGLICLMHGDNNISTRNLARQIGAKHIEPATPEQAQKWTGYLVGGTSPFGCKTPLTVYAEHSIQTLPVCYINGGKRGFLIAIAPAALLSLSPIWVEVAVS